MKLFFYSLKLFFRFLFLTGHAHTIKVTIFFIHLMLVILQARLYFSSPLKKKNRIIGKKKNYTSPTCLGVTPGIRMSKAKSDSPNEITGLVLPKHSLERDLVASLYLKNKKGT